MAFIDHLQPINPADHGIQAGVHPHVGGNESAGIDSTKTGMDALTPDERAEIEITFGGSSKRHHVSETDETDAPPAPTARPAAPRPLNSYKNPMSDDYDPDRVKHEQDSIRNSRPQPIKKRGGI